MSIIALLRSQGIPGFLRRQTALLSAALVLAHSASAPASGILLDGAGARSQAMGGAAVTDLQSALEALAANPAALSAISEPTLELGGTAGWIHGEFSNRANRAVEMTTFGAVPHGAVGARCGPLALALGLVPDSALRADWRYRDSPGGLGGATSYGERTHFSELALIRTALAASVVITPELSLGAGVGLLYNRSRLQAPYLIQSQPQLAGAKTLLDLDAEGWGWNAQVGLLWKPRTDLTLGASYTSPSRVRATGRATSDAGRQLSDLGLEDVDATTDFEAEVTNDFPQLVSLGLGWRATSRLQLFAQLDWINWADSYNTLEVRLRNTRNPLYRSLLAGKRDLDDDVPLDWRDQWVPRLGAEYRLTDSFTLRAGYRYGRNPVPSETLTPLTAAIAEHVLTAGAGYRRGRFFCDFAYQWHVPQRESVGQSRLLAGEYRDSEVEVSIHSIALTVGVEF